MRFFGLIGHPLTHSFSEKYFTAKFVREGLADCRFLLFPISSIKDLNSIVQQNPGLEGLNVTIPYKQQVLSYLDSRSGIPEGLNACNCIQIKNGKRTGFNTDLIAFKNSLLPLLRPVHNRALILGNGGAAAAVRFALKDLGIDYAIVSRTLQNGAAFTYNQLDESIIRDRLLIINTTPLGMFPDMGKCPDFPYRFLTEEHLLFDLVYNPSKTVFLQKGEEWGATIKNGEEMLILQAEESWRIWNQ